MKSLSQQDNEQHNNLRLAARLQELQTEFRMGETQLADLDRQRSQLRDTLLRISGAIQVLEEMLNQATSQPAVHLNGHAPSPAPVGAVQE